MEVVFWASMISALGTLIGGIVGILISKPSKIMVSKLNGFAAGVMVEVVFIEIIPSALEKIALNIVIVYSFFGLIVMILLSNLYEERKKEKDLFLKMALFTTLGIMVHNFPEGIIMGVGFAFSTGLGAKMSLIIAAHDVPEGLVVAASLKSCRINTYKIIALLILVAVPTVLGTFIGIQMGFISEIYLGILLSIVSGIMLYITFFELMKSSIVLSDYYVTFKSIACGIILGLVINIFL
ncbi:ZIP family metal transporter [Clostridium grantii]|uniref:Zinc transporter, ZIP family n=1 Tax=Clostridium grantii DSM 8605 TaxID=1121316 RepID=A0A1M5TJP6_9CLOT|nr:ZIP family metal transporter [Clostridium grantii]SHH51025.1 zinc transporter, ZIP family [Clostridium grantii DSM 8605]